MPPPLPGKASPGLWIGSPWFLAQMTHVLAGSGFLFAFSGTHGWLPWLCAVIVFVWSIVKEFVVDLSPFEEDSVMGSVQDAMFYNTGGGCGWLGVIGWFWGGVGGIVVTTIVLFLIDLWNQKHPTRSILGASYRRKMRKWSRCISSSETRKV